MRVLPDVLQILEKEAAKYKIDHKRFQQMVRYNVGEGFKTRGVNTIYAYNGLVNKDTMLSDEMVIYLAWCLEIIFGTFLIQDDIMDLSLKRRGKPCWHTIEGIGLKAVNDAAMLQSLAFSLLKVKFSHLECYADLMDLLNKALFVTQYGQKMDVDLSKKNAISFTFEDYRNLTYLKTAFIAMHIPFSLGSRLARVNEGLWTPEVGVILTEIGAFFQIENDFLDCFGSSKLGASGTDIKENKCTWLAIKFLERANKEQKVIMEKCYGQEDPEKTSQIKQLYEDLRLPEAFAIYKKESYDKLNELIQKLPKNISPTILLNFLNRTYRRFSK